MEDRTRPEAGPPQAASGEPRSLLKNPNLYVIFSITLTSVLGVTSIAPALPLIRDTLDVSAGRIGLLITVFTLPGVVLSPLLGILADRWGRKTILVPSLLLFGLAGGACALARDYDTLLWLRFLQGVGASSLGALNVTLIGDLFRGRDRGAAMGYNASVLSVGTASYPALGGALALIGWWAPFVLALVGVPVALFVVLVLEGRPTPEPQPFGRYLREIGHALRRRQIAGLFLVSLATFIILYGGILTYFPMLLAERFEASSLAIGLLMAVLSLATAVTSSRLGALSRRFGEVTLVKAGFLGYALALLLIPVLPNMWLLVIPGVFFGIGQGLNFPSALTLLTHFAPEDQRGAIMSLNGTVLRGGQTLGPLVMGAAYAVGDFGAVYVTGAVLAVAMIGLLTVVLRGAPRPGTEAAPER